MMSSVMGSTSAVKVPPGSQGSIDSAGNLMAYTITDDQQLMRFLILGTEGGSYYAREQELTSHSVQCVSRLLEAGEGEMVVDRVVEVVSKGRCIRMNTPLLVLALCCRSEDSKTKAAAFRAIMDVCTIPTHLFHFVDLIKLCRDPNHTAGWGRGLRRAVARWYNQFANNPQRLAMLVTKYRQRGGWSHADILRLGHVKPINDAVGFILRYMSKGLQEARDYYLEDGVAGCTGHHLPHLLTYLQAVEEVRHLQAPKRPAEGEGMDLGEEEDVVQRVISLVQQHDLVREHVPTGMLRFAGVWQSLLDKMPLMALMRNLNKITLTGLLDTTSNLDKVVSKLTNKEAVRMSKVHPYAILTAWYTYRAGKGARGQLRWQPVPEVCEAMEQAFYMAFGNVLPTHKRILIALDVSSSMDWTPITGGRASVTPRLASVAMSLVTLHAESSVDMVAFTDFLLPLQLQKDCKLEEAVATVEGMPCGGTDCSKPMMWAIDNNKQYDVFVVYTDSETRFSSITPAAALNRYRKHSGIHNARLAVVGMSSGGFTIADPKDLNMMDVVGFDPDTPSVLQQFIAGTLYDV
ncbi:RNA-binding protein RO60-like [Babylonia areolata]|uniref:RNA-binding protein RO60-like n=1 Tax=Babylonia areolata TaxID=304850 RepID=UPI003FD1FC59